VLFFVLVLLSSVFFVVTRDFFGFSGSGVSEGVQVALVLHYDTYYAGVNLTAMHFAFERALSNLRSVGFPMSKVMVVTWRNTLEDVAERGWFLDVLRRYGVSVGEGQVGLYLAVEEAHDAWLLHYALDVSFRGVFGRHPYFVAGFSASSSTYSRLVDHGVKVSFFNLWEEGEDFSFRGFSTGDALYGANWEGSPHQPYKPSRRGANVPGLSFVDELDIWEVHWLFRNPSYAFMGVNSRNFGSVHPFDLLHGDVLGLSSCGVEKALDKFGVILDLVDYNVVFNPLLVISYPVEVSYLMSDDVFGVWCGSVGEFMQRGYRFVDAVELRANLEGLGSGEAPLTPVYVWCDNFTDSDVVVRGEHTPFAMVCSPYGRFVYARRDAGFDAGQPLVSVVSYVSAQAYNLSFQSVRELAGLSAFKMNTFVDGVPVEMRWTGDVQSVSVFSGGVVVVDWAYLKGEVSSVAFDVDVCLTPYGVLLDKRLHFVEDAVAEVSFVQYVNVQESSPVALGDEGVCVWSDKGGIFNFSSSNVEAVVWPVVFNDTLVFAVGDSCALGVTLVCGSPSVVRVVDEVGFSSFETLEFSFSSRRYGVGDEVRLAYVLVPSDGSVAGAQSLAASVCSAVLEGECLSVDFSFLYFFVVVGVIIFLMVAAGGLLFRLRQFSCGSVWRGD